MSLSEYSEKAFSERTLRGIIDATHEGIVFLNENGVITEANEAVLRLFEVSRDEYVGRQFEYYINHSDRQRFREDMKLVLRGKNVHMETKVLRGDRTGFMAEIHASPLRDSSKEIYSTVWVIQDKTHRMKVQEQIEKTTSELTALMKSSTEIIRTRDMHQKLKTIAQAIQGLGWRRVLITLTDENLETTDIVSAGLTSEEEEYLWEHRQPGQVWRHRFGPVFERFRMGEFYYLPWSDPFVRDQFKTGTVESRVPKEEMVDWDPQDLLYAPLRLPDGRVVGRISIDDPIGGRRPTKESLAPLGLFVHQAAVAIENAYLIRDLEIARNQVKEYADQLEAKVEERTGELHELEKKYESVVENANDGIGIVQDGVFVFVNNKTVEMTGYSEKEWLGKDVYWLVPKENLEKLKKTTTRLLTETSALKGASSRTCTVPMTTKDGKELLLETTSTTIQYRGKPAVLVFARDVTERERMQKQLENAQRLAVMGELAASVGHDLRNPLTGMKGAVYYLKMKLASNLDKKSREMLDIIEGDIQYSNKIVNDLLDFSKDIRLVASQTNVKSVIGETLSKMKIPRRVKILDLTKRTPEVLLDVDQMKRVFENIIKNAVEAMPRGGRLEIRSHVENDFLKVTFQDTGEGISKENMSKLGTPLFTTKAKGVGMGLAICKRLTEAHGGSISIESKEKAGTCVTVRVPIHANAKLHEQRGEGR